MPALVTAKNTVIARTLKHRWGPPFNAAGAANWPYPDAFTSRRLRDGDVFMTQTLITPVSTAMGVTVIVFSNLSVPIPVGSAVTSTVGIAAGTTVVSANPVTRLVTLSAATTAIIPAGTPITFTPPVPLPINPPVNQVAPTITPVIPVSVAAGDELTANPGQWLDAASLAYAWTALDGSPPSGTPVDAAVYKPVAGDVGDQFICTVTATNVIGTTKAVSAPSNIVIA